jgi:predicted enzyme related to lactoylglutathione lyase
VETSDSADWAGYPLGAPWWLDLASPEASAARTFLGGLFGWDTEILADPRLSDYTVLTFPDTDFFGVTGLTASADPETPALWTCFFRIPDLAEAEERVLEAGGHVLLEATRVASLGSMALAADRQGAGFGLWEAYTPDAALHSGVPGSLLLIELSCPDAPDAEQFYKSVLGTSPGPSRPGEQNIGWQISATLTAGDPRALWTPCFQVADLEAALTRLNTLGGEIVTPPTTTRQGLVATVRGPGTATFGLVQTS